MQYAVSMEACLCQEKKARQSFDFILSKNNSFINLRQSSGDKIMKRFI